MQFTIEKPVTDKYPNLTVGLLVCRDIQNGPAPAGIVLTLRQAEQEVRAKFANADLLKAHPSIAAWQQVHAGFGSNPNKFPSSIHALCKRVVKGGELPSINTLVDVYNVISLRHLLPVGGEDLDCCNGDISLALAAGSEAFTPLGGDANELPEPGEVIYKDDDGALCRKFNWREAARTCLSGKTKNAVLVIECVPPAKRSELEVAMQELRELVLQHCGGTIDALVLDSAQPSASLTVAS